MLLRLLGFAALLVLASAAQADERGEPPPPSCAPQFSFHLPGWRRYFEIHPPGAPADELALEARRIGDNPDILRHLDRLYLGLEDEKLAVLIDCAIGGNGYYRYLYERYDALGGFYVVTTYEYEDGYYLLVNRKTGLTFRAFSLPDWSADKKRFLHWRCNAMNGPNELYVMRPTQEGLRTEAAIPLPCATNCQVSWQTASAISVSCPDFGDTIKRYRLVLQDGTWTKVPD
jgi:hypothetical protein